MGPVLPSIVAPVTFRKAGLAWDVTLGTIHARGMSAARERDEALKCPSCGSIRLHEH
jgi:hypothetical protein